MMPDSSTTQHQTMTDVMTHLNEACILIRAIDDNILQRVHLNTFSICGKVHRFTSGILRAMSALSDIVELMQIASCSPAYYVPTYVDEDFRYTDNQGIVYNARVLCIRDDEIDMIHTGADSHYGRFTVNIHDIQFSRAAGHIDK